ncbi:MAG: integration host factor subunit beta [Deltaproteobacteria bacterium]|nr:integration host factor subunit beta [Deltaproteobacteria bacterium]RKX59659.1 MAG: integration host factor subunit beta [Thermodesulfobacteriota bacterium]MBW1947308.1 integration host factor subunit beta [Deltaproteobacteria bacterium]MBW1965917.1 integration host factor subunit beta [Deltaproteobacteria bacterium]MBW2098319.1 integration host factor subunit beta [Deltaproteobacteria bacterium]
MNKSDLIEVLAKETGLNIRLAEFVVDEVFNAMTEALVKGEGVEIRGFGSFTVRKYDSYIGRNPKTGKNISVSPKKLPFFKVGKELRERVIDKVGQGIK